MRLFFRVWYWYISTLDRQGTVLFMNYGYADPELRILLNDRDEKNRYSIQLYHLVATGADLKDKEVLEVGSGRGGGLSYISRYLKPRTTTGVDLNEKAIRFCNQYYADSHIRFVQSNAQHLTFPDLSFDVVINIESSHGYADMDKFLSEVYRVLRPGGYFLFADFRPREDIELLTLKLTKSQLVLRNKHLITTQVLKALHSSTAERLDLIETLVPALLCSVAKKFAAIEGTSMYKSFLNHEFEYVYYVMQK